MKNGLSTKTKHKSLKNTNFKGKMEEKAVERNCKRGQRNSERTRNGYLKLKTADSFN